MILGENRKFIGKAPVCFLDVLGFSNDVLSIWHNPDSDPLKKILSIKDKMPIFDEDIKKDDCDSHRRYVCRVNTFSDSTMICFGYDEDTTVGDMVLGLEAIIGSIVYIWSTFIIEEYTVREAIDYGDIYWDTNELIGPAFIHAYELESEVTKNSGVIIASSLNRFLLYDTEDQRHRHIEDLESMKKRSNQESSKKNIPPSLKC